jgi:hypothetical protein
MAEEVFLFLANHGLVPQQDKFPSSLKRADDDPFEA